jgi:hypothetical protein
MGRETVLTSVRWPSSTFPIFSPIAGLSPAPLPETSLSLPGKGSLVTADDDLTFSSTTILPLHFTYWRAPIPSHYTLTNSTLRLTPSFLNLTALNGNYAGPLQAPPSPAVAGQTFIARRQTSSLFTYSIDFTFTPDALESEFGVSAFLTQNHHLDMGIVLLPRKSATTQLEGVGGGQDPSELIPQLRIRGMSYVPVPAEVVLPVPRVWVGKELTLEVRADNATHYVFRFGPAKRTAEMREIAIWSNDAVSWGFTGVLLGAYATSNGGNGTAAGYISRWRYASRGQIRD